MHMKVDQQTAHCAHGVCALPFWGVGQQYKDRCVDLHVAFTLGLTYAGDQKQGILHPQAIEEGMEGWG